MIRPTVVNLTVVPYDEYIGRANPSRNLAASIYANPFSIRDDSERPDAIRRYRGHVLNSPAILRGLARLAGKRLGCWCSPKLCHGEYLAACVAALPMGSAVAALKAKCKAEAGQDDAAALNYAAGRGWIADEAITWQDVAECDAVRVFIQEVPIPTTATATREPELF